MDTYIDIIETPIDPTLVSDLVADSGAGSIVTFTGTVRDNTKNKKVVRLEFESYIPMAKKEIEKILFDISRKYNIIKVAVYHRVGALDIGDIAVCISVATAHRDAGFVVCKYIIDTLKQTVPIWKKEIFEDGANMGCSPSIIRLIAYPMEINLLSDTVTKPTPAMLEAMFSASVGDDVFGRDPSVNLLQDEAAGLFKHEAALFCPSGTMTNQLAIKVHTNPLDEMICDKTAHVYQYELGGYSFHSGIAINPVETSNGKLGPDDLKSAIRPNAEWYPQSKLVVLENTCNKAGGCYYDLQEMIQLSEICRSNKIRFHLDGARLFNALVETKNQPEEVGPLFDSLSICLSKGLGAPVGSLLIGSKMFIAQAKKFRKVFGGGMRQAGYLAAAGTYALNHHIDRLQEDHLHAKLLAESLSKATYVEKLNPVYTNIVVAHIDQNYTAETVVKKLEHLGLYSAAIGPQTIRFVTHLDIDRTLIDRACEIVRRGLA